MDVISANCYDIDPRDGLKYEAKIVYDHFVDQGYDVDIRWHSPADPPGHWYMYARWDDEESSDDLDEFDTTYQEVLANSDQVLQKSARVSKASDIAAQILVVLGLSVTAGMVLSFAASLVLGIIAFSIVFPAVPAAVLVAFVRARGEGKSISEAASRAGLSAGTWKAAEKILEIAFGSIGQND